MTTQDIVFWDKITKEEEHKAKLLRSGNTEEQPICAVDSYGAKYWELNGKLHRTDGPAVEYVGGSKEWWIDGKLHRLDGPAIENSGKYWYVNGKLHRLDGPACNFANGNKHWYVNDKRHRTDGPAVEVVGNNQWWIEGKQLTYQEFNETLQ